MKKEKNNKKKIIAIIGGIAAGVIVAGGGYKLYTESINTVSKASLYGSPEYLAQNNKFESYLGDNMTSAQVKQLLSLINTNNITAMAKNNTSMTSKEYKTIGVRFVSEKSKTTIPIDGKSYTTDVMSILENIHSENTYNVSIHGSKAYDTAKNNNDGFDYIDTDNAIATTSNTAGYYSNIYIRLIDIVENQNN